MILQLISYMNYLKSAITNNEEEKKIINIIQTPKKGNQMEEEIDILFGLSEKKPKKNREFNEMRFFYYIKSDVLNQSSNYIPEIDENEQMKMEMEEKEKEDIEDEETLNSIKIDLIEMGLSDIYQFIKKYGITKIDYDEKYKQQIYQVNQVLKDMVENKNFSPQKINIIF